MECLNFSILYDSRPPSPLTSRPWFGRRPYCWWNWCSMWRRGSPRSRNSTPSSWNSSITSTGWSLEIYVSFKRARRRRPFLDYCKISLRKRALKNDINLKLRFFSVLNNRVLAKEINFSERKISQPFELNCIDFKLIFFLKNICICAFHFLFEYQRW